jgi:hypothetical protein
MEEAHDGSLGTEPVVGTSVPLHEESDLRSSRTSAAVLGRPAAAFRPDPSLAQPAANRLSPDPKTLPLLQHLDEVGIVELGIDLSVKHQNPFPDLRTKDVWGRPAPTPMGQPLGSFFPISGQETLRLTIADLHECCPLLQQEIFSDDLLENRDPLRLTRAQGEELHLVRLLGGDILAWQ